LEIIHKKIQIIFREGGFSTFFNPPAKRIIMILRLSDIDRSTPYTGKRARYLATLMKEGFPIPEGFVISADSYAKYMKDIDKELADLSEDNAAQKASKILGLLQNSPYPIEVSGETDKSYKEMGMIQNLPKEAARFMAAGKDISNVAVRVSNETELPLVPSFLNLRGNEEVTIAIRRLFSMIFSRSMLHYSLKKKIPKSLLMENAIIVQKFVPGEIFGVVMKHPFDDSKWLVEYCESKDLFNNLLYGSADPYRLVVDGLSMEILKDPFANRTDFAGGKYSIKKIIEYVEKAEAALDGKIALEFCVARDRIWVIGARNAKDFQYNAKGNIKKSGGRIENSDIILLDNCNVDIVPFSDRISGVIARHGSYSSRMAMVCREMELPFMLMDRDFSEGSVIEIKNGELVEYQNETKINADSEQTEKTTAIELEEKNDFQKPTPIASASIPSSPKYSPRITKLCAMIENLSELKEASDYDEVLTIEPNIPADSEGWMYMAKEGDLIEFLKRATAERKAKIIFESFEPEKMRELDQKKVGLVIKTPYDMLRTREISSVASLTIFDISNIAKLLANIPSPVFDDVIMKQISTAIRYFNEHGVECYCSNLDMEIISVETMKNLILMGVDGIVASAREAAKASSLIERSERKILIELARRSFKL
jgi:phosphohistidine swiveling domain-containing protein